MIKGLDYGMGSDMWNISKSKHKRFTKVSQGFENLSKIVPILHKVTAFSRH